MIVLGIETSCDDSSVAVVDGERRVLAQVSVNQDRSHAPFGGVVPEVASRQHTENLLPIIDQVLSEAKLNWEQITAIAVTSRPGLIGSLLVGVVTAKTLALAKNKQLIDVNHIEGHLLAALLRDEQYTPKAGFDFPYLGLAVSGGHTHLFEVRKPGQYKLLGKTIDDAAGEAFDKFAKMLRLGFPGGVAVDKLAQTGNPEAYQFPRALEHDRSLNFSFSGLKTAALRAIEKIPPTELAIHKADLSASYQEAIVDILIKKLVSASKETGLTNWTITGGVSANSSLRAHAQLTAQGMGCTLALPPLRYCTDNAAMIALAGVLKLQAGLTASKELSPSASSLPTDWLNT